MQQWLKTHDMIELVDSFGRERLSSAMFCIHPRVLVELLLAKNTLKPALIDKFASAWHQTWFSSINSRPITSDITVPLKKLIPKVKQQDVQSIGEGLGVIVPTTADDTEIDP